MVRVMTPAATLALVLWLGCFSMLNAPGYVLFLEGRAIVASSSNMNSNVRSFEIPMAAEASSTVVRDYWPTASWRCSTAEEQGMNSTKLEEMMEYVRDESLMLDSVVVVRNGYVVLEEYLRPNAYTQNIPHNLYSCTKSVTSMLIGIALGEGYIDRSTGSFGFAEKL